MKLVVRLHAISCEHENAKKTKNVYARRKKYNLKILSMRSKGEVEVLHWRDRRNVFCSNLVFEVEKVLKREMRQVKR
jgi:hypothetical protein